MRFARSFIAVLALALAGTAPAQPRTVQADSLPERITTERAALARADSAGALDQAFAACVRLAPLVGKPEAVQLLQRAIALADSMKRADLGILAHGLLAKRSALAGDHAAAYAQAMIADSMGRGERARENGQYLRTIGRLEAARDSADRAATDRERGLALALMEAEGRARLWTGIAIAMAGLGLLAVLALLYRTGGRTRRLQAAVEALDREVKALKAPVNRRREPVAAPQPAPPPTAVTEAMAPVVDAMFRRTGPERLQALAKAREQGDVEKALRVVATLKPQLLSFDPGRFAPLLASLKAPDAPGNSAQWNADLDALEAALKELLGGH